MGQGRYVIDDPSAGFGVESRRKKEPLRVHFALSPDGARKVRAAVEAASTREKPTVISIPCRIDERDRHRGGYRPAANVEFVVSVMDDESPSRYDETHDPPALCWSRQDLPKLLELCDRLIAGEFDYRVPVNDDLDVWYWGSGARF